MGNITVSPPPTITGTATATAFTTTYGTASANQSFSISGSNLTANLVATAPTGFEVSSDGTTYATTATFTQASGSASGTLRVRLSATAVPGGTYNSQNIALTSTGATTVNIATAASGNTVSVKALTITGLTGANKEYDGLTTASATGTAALSGVVGSDTVTLGGTASYNFSSAAVGTAQSITTTGYTISGAQASYYTLTQPAGLTASITTRSLTITANAEPKTYGNAVSSGSGKTAFTSSGLQNSETIGSVTLTYAGGYNATDSAGTYTITPSAATGGTFTASNYALTYANGTLTVTAIVPGAPTISSITPGDQSLSVAFTAPASDGGSAITNYEYSTNGGSNWTTRSPSATTSPLSITGLTNGTSYNVQIRAVNTVGSGTATASTSGTPAAPSGTMSTSGTLSAFSATYPSASAQQSFSVSGTNLTGSLTVTPPAGFEVSLTSGSGFGSTATISANGTLASTTVYVRLAASTNATTYSGNVAISGGSAATQNVAIPSSTVSKATPTVSAAPTASAIAYGQTLASSTLSSGTASVAGTFAFTTPATAPSVGTASQSVTFTPTDTTNYNTASTTASVTVNKATPTVSVAPTASGITYGQTLANSTLSGGTASVNGTYAFTTPATAPSVGTASQSVTFTPTDTTNYNTASTTASVTVSQASLTITGLSVTSKTYDGTTTATLSGSAAYSGLVNSESFSVSGTPSATFGNATVGTSKAVTVTGYTAPNGNYSLTQPSLTGNITTRALTVTASDVSKATGVALTGSAGSTAFSSSGLQNGETIGTVTIVYGDAGTTSGNGSTIGTYAGQVTPSAATGGTFTASNYAITYATGNITVTAAPVVLMSFDFAGFVGNETTATSNSTNSNANFSSSTISRGAGLTASGNADRYNAESWAVTSIANAVSGNDYMEFTITPNSGYQFTVSSILVQWQRSGSGNTQIALRSSVDSYASDLDTVKSVTDSTATQTFTWTFAQSAATSAVTYRLYSYAEVTTGTGGPGDGTGNDIVVTGTVTQLPPTVSAATINGTVGTGLSANITATNIPTSYAISSGNLSAMGLTLNATSGQISGTPILAGNGTIVAVTASNGAGTSAPANLTFNIAAIAPTIGSPTVSSIATTSATLGATVTANGGETLSARGTAWGTSASPTGNALAEGNTTVSAFTHSRTDLTANTLYYYRGYATNSIGTAYTADGNFTTLPLAPTVGTGSAVSASGFTANWSHPTMGVASYTYTLDFSTDNTFATSVTTVTGISSASTSRVLTALNASTTYYYRVKAVNTQGSSDWSATSAGVSTSAALGAISTSGTLSAFTATYPAASAEQSFSVSGTDLTGSLTVTAPAGFEVSLTSGSAYGASATISASGTLASTTVYVRLPASATPGSYSGNVAISGGDAATQTVAASGTVSQASQTITFEALATKNATDAAFALTGTVDSGLSITYTSSNTSVATISGNLVTLVGGGSTTITASQAGNTNYAAATSVTQTLTVNKVAQTISGVTSTASKTYGDAAYSLGATVGSGLTITYASSNESVATIAANGTVTIVAPGTTTLTASQAGDARYSAAADATQTLTVSKANPALTFSSSNSTTVNATVTLNATSASTGAVTYTSSNNAVVSIASSVATGVAIGTATITASQAADSNYNAATANQTMIVAATPSLIFSENMGNATTTIALNIFQNNGTLTFGNGAQASPADVRTSSASSGYTGSSGNGNIFFTSTPGNYGFSIESINVSNYSNLSLSFGYRKESGSVHAAFSVDYWDGSAWQTIANSSANLFNEAANAATGWYLSKSLSLPPGANINGLKIRFVKSGTASIRIDDVQLLGSIALCEAPVLTRATLPVAGGFTVNWNAATGAGNYTVLHSASKNMTGATSVNTASTTLALTGLSEGLRFVQLRANNAAGASANSTTQVNQLQSIAAGATKYVSLASAPSAQTVAGIFGSANESGLVAGATDSNATTILLLNSDGSTANTIFYDTDVNEWREGPTDMGSTAIAVGKAFMLKNNTGSTDYFLLVGTPREGGSQPAVSLSSAGNFTLLTTGRTSNTTLTDLNLNPGTGSGQFKAASKPSSADRLIVPPANSTDPVTTYWYHTGSGQWYDGLSPVPSASIPAGQGFFIKRATDSTFSTWTMPAE